jgi:NADH dehydrogenase FAD-containing subunit
VVVGSATAIDPCAGRITIDGASAVAYDVASLDVGSTVQGLDLPGVRAHALATRPIRAFVDRLDAGLADASASSWSAPARRASSSASRCARGCGPPARRRR